MNVSVYEYIYLVSNFFGTYLIFKFMCIFFDRKETNKKVELVSYLLYYVIISAVYVIFKHPVLNLLCNILLFFILTFNYNAKIKLRLMAIVFMYTILLSIEGIVVLGLRVLEINKWQGSTGDIELMIALIATKIFSYMVILIVGNFKKVKNNEKIVGIHWISIFLIPIGTLYTTFILITTEYVLNLSYILISITILFSINILVFYLYDTLAQEYESKMEKTVLQRQNKYYLKQFEIMDHSQKKIMGLRHDMKNHLLALRSFIIKKNDKDALQYISKFIDSLDYKDEYAKSGNIHVDSILNYKIQEAKDWNIEVGLKLQIPAIINISPFDISIILGNLIDNAIEATSRLKNNKRINIYLYLDRNMLFINVSNTFDGRVVYKNNKIQSLHKDKENHGIGLNNVQKVLDKYHGEMKVCHTNHIFEVDIIMYNS